MKSKIAMLAIALAALATAGTALAQVAPGDFTVTWTTVPVACDDIVNGRGSFTVTVGGETGACADPAATTYTVNATPVAGSAPGGGTPPFTTITTYIGFPSGDFLFANAGIGAYTLTVTMTASAVCAPPVNPQVFTVPVSIGDGCTGVPSLGNVGLAALAAFLALGGVFAIARQRLV